MHRVTVGYCLADICLLYQPRAYVETPGQYVKRWAYKAPDEYDTQYEGTLFDRCEGINNWHAGSDSPPHSKAYTKTGGKVKYWQPTGNVKYKGIC